MAAKVLGVDADAILTSVPVPETHPLHEPRENGA